MRKASMALPSLSVAGFDTNLSKGLSFAPKPVKRPELCVGQTATQFDWKCFYFILLEGLGSVPNPAKLIGEEKLGFKKEEVGFCWRE